MSKLIAFIISGFTTLGSAFFAFYTRKLGTATAAVLTFVSLIAVFVYCINEILDTVINVLSPPAWLLNSVGMFIPADFAAVLAAIVSGRICRAAFDTAYRKIDIVSKAN